MFLIFVIFVLTVAVLAGAYYIISRKDKEALLRLSPPELAYFECQLPVDYQNSNAKMTRFYATLYDLCLTDAKTREAGEGVVHVGFLAEIPEGKDTPEVSFIIACTVDKMTEVKSRMVTTYGLDLQLKNLKENPFAEELEKTKALIPITRPFPELREKLEERKKQKQAEAEVAPMQDSLPPPSFPPPK